MYGECSMESKFALYVQLTADGYKLAKQIKAAGCISTDVDTWDDDRRSKKIMHGHAKPASVKACVPPPAAAPPSAAPACARLRLSLRLLLYLPAPPCKPPPAASSARASV